MVKPRKDAKVKYRVTIYYKQHSCYHEYENDLGKWKDKKYNVYNRTLNGAKQRAVNAVSLPGSVFGGIPYKAEVWAKGRKGNYTVKVAVAKLTGYGMPVKLHEY